MMDHAILLRNLDALQPIRKPSRDVLLKEPLLTDAGRKPFHRDRPENDMRQHQGRNHFVVGGKFAFGNPVIGKQDLLGVRDHHVSLTTSRADLSWRMPTSRGWRNFP